MWSIALTLLCAFNSDYLFQSLNKVTLDKKAVNILVRLAKAPETVGEVKLTSLNATALQANKTIWIALPNKNVEVTGHIVTVKNGGCQLVWKNKKNLIMITVLENSAIGLIYFDDKVYCIEPISLNQSIHAIRQIDQGKLKD